MNPEIKAKWVAALRSGEYKQAFGRLRDGDLFCCLGVLCDIHAKETEEGWWDDRGYYGREREVLPTDVCEWARIPAKAGHNVALDEDRCLSAMNDQGDTFAEIADIIEREL